MLDMRLMAVLIIAVLLIAPGGALAGHDPDEGLPPKDSGPQVPIVQPQVNAKSLIIEFHITSSALTVQGVKVTYGRTRTYIADPDLFRIHLEDFNGQVLARVQTYDPRGIRVY